MCSITKVIAVEIEDKPGALVSMLNILGDNKVNLEYSYAFLAKKANSAFMVFRVADNDKAIRVLTENGIRPICHDCVTCPLFITLNSRGFTLILTIAAEGTASPKLDVRSDDRTSQTSGLSVGRSCLPHSLLRSLQDQVHPAAHSKQ